MILCEILGVLIAKIRATHEDEVIDMVTYPPIFVRSGLRPLVTLFDFTKVHSDSEFLSFRHFKTRITFLGLLLKRLFHNYLLTFFKPDHKCDEQKK